MKLRNIIYNHFGHPKPEAILHENKQLGQPQYFIIEIDQEISRNTLTYPPFDFTTFAISRL